MAQLSGSHQLPHLNAGYEANTFAYADSPDVPVKAGQWVEVFRASCPTYCKYAAQDDSVHPEKRQACVLAFEQSFNGALDAAKETGRVKLSDGEVKLTCIALCRLREECLRNAGFGDIFKKVKDFESKTALEVLPGVCEQLDQEADVSKRLELALRGILAGNIFDLGASASANIYKSGAAASFNETRSKLLPRPWVLDDMDAAVKSLSLGKYRKAMIFVDNAGSDTILGILPFSRELIKLGMQVLLVANELPSINDMTAAELRDVLKQAAGDVLIRQALADGKLGVVSSGSGLPVIDLRCLSQECAECARDTDLIILDGMGRSIETNLWAQLRVDSMRIGMVKHREVATLLKGRLYDCVCRFIPASN